MDYFKEYREAYDEMLIDETLGELHEELSELQDLIALTEKPFNERIDKAREGIVQITLDQQRTVVLHGIEAKFSKPRKSTKWKNVAMSFEPSVELIEEHSTVGNPSVAIKVHEPIEID